MDRYQLGRMIADRYCVERLEREDETSISVAAKHLNLDELVVVNFLRPEVRLDVQASMRYSRATKALVRIKTEHAVRVLDVGLALSVGPYLVLEHLEGSTLAELLRSEGKLPVARAVDYVLQACKGLAVAHAAGIVHGQIRPTTLLLARQAGFETLKLVDFPTQARPGPPLPEAAQYMAPEVLHDDANVDRRADVWSLGVVLYELVTGRPAFDPARQGGSSAGAPADLTLSLPLRRIIGRCLQPERALRFQNVDELAAELLPLTTLTEVFRGSLTGSFSRQMFLAAAAQARASASPVLRARPPRRARPLVQAEPSLLSRVLAALSDDAIERWQERCFVRWQSWSERLRRILPGSALAQLGVVLGTALLVALGAAQLGSIQLVPPPPTKRAPALAAVGLAPALAPAPALAAVAPTPDAYAAPPEQQTWALLPRADVKPPPAAAPPEKLRARVPRAPARKARPRAASTQRSRDSVRLIAPAAPAKHAR